MNRYTLKAVVLAGVCLAPLAAMAQDDNGLGFAMPETAPNTQALTNISNQPVEVYDNSIEAGLKWQSATSGYFGQFDGNYERGIEATAAFQLMSRDSWKTNGTSYFSLVGRDLDFTNKTYGPESSLDLKVGNQGTWGITAGYDAITFTQSTAFSSIYNTNGTLNNGASSLGAKPLTQAQVNALLSNEEGQLMQTRRDIGSLTGNYRFGDWVFSGDYQHVHKTGLMEQSMEAGNVKVAFPEAIDYDIDNFTAAAAYYTKPMQVQFGYTFSNFDDNNTYSRVENITTVGTAYSVTNPQFAAYQQAPSNSAHTIYGNFAYNLTPTTRLNARIKDSLELQDAAIGNDINGYSLGASPVQGINGIVNTMYGNLQVTSRPLEKTSVKASYTFDIRDDMTENRNNMNIVAATGNTGSGQAPAVDCTIKAPCLAGMPLDWTKQTLKVEGEYEVFRHTTLAVGDTFNSVQRDNTLVDSSQENELWIEGRSELADNLNGSVRYGHSIRDATVNQAAVSGFSFNAAPWYQGDRVQDAVTVRTNYQPTDAVQLGLMAKGAYDTYPGVILVPPAATGQYSGYGMQRDYNATIGPDVAWQPRKDLSLHAFYEFERNYTDAQEAQSAADPAPITETTTEDTHTAGAGGEWKATDKLSVGTDYLFMMGATNIDVFNNQPGACVNTVTVACALPNVNTITHSFKLHATYEIMPGVSLWAGYSLDILHDDDFLYGVAPYSGSASASFVDTDPPPWYSVQTVATKVKFQW